MLNTEKDIIERCARECDDLAESYHELAHKLDLDDAMNLSMKANAAECCAARIRRLKRKTGFDF